MLRGTNTREPSLQSMRRAARGWLRRSATRRPFSIFLAFSSPSPSLSSEGKFLLERRRGCRYPRVSLPRLLPGNIVKRTATIRDIDRHRRRSWIDSIVICCGTTDYSLAFTCHFLDSVSCRRSRSLSLRFDPQLRSPSAPLDLSPMKFLGQRQR